MNAKITVISILAATLLIGGAVMFSGANNSGAGTKDMASNVSIVDGQQVITITAKGGYSPRVTMAQAGLPTIIKVNTQGTFDCSSGLTSPSLGINKNLPPSRETAIAVPSQKAGATVRGLCVMGMYSFAVNFN